MTKHIILEQCLNFLKSEEIKNEIKDILKPVIDYIFKEATLDLKIKKDFDFWKKEIEGEEIAYNTLRLKKIRGS